MGQTRPIPRDGNDEYPALALDRAAITIFRDTTSLQAARQVKGVVRQLGFRMASTQIHQGRTLSLVCGYHPHTYPPQVAYAAGLRFRFAVILDTYRPEKGYMFFDDDLFLRVVSNLCQLIEHDEIRISLKQDSCLRSFDELGQLYASIEEDEREPPLRIELNRDGHLAGFVETEFWVNIGGPAPYHDSYTASVYVDEDRSEEFQRIVESVSAAIGAEVVGRHRGDIEKQPYRSWWSRVSTCLGLT